MSYSDEETFLQRLEDGGEMICGNPGELSLCFYRGCFEKRIQRSFLLWYVL